MAEQQPSFLDRISWPLRLVFVLVLLAVVGYLVYQRVLSPRLAQMATLDTQIENLGKQIAQLEAQVRAHLPITAEERSEWSRTQAKLVERIPQDYKLAELVEQIAILAKKSNLEDALISTNEKVALVKPPEVAEPIARTTVAAATSAAQARSQQGQQAPPPRRPVHIADILSAGYFPVTITFHGQFRNQGQFVEDISKIPQLLEIDSLDIVREYPETAFRLVLRAYHSGKVVTRV